MRLLSYKNKIVVISFSAETVVAIVLFEKGKQPPIRATGKGGENEE